MMPTRNAAGGGDAGEGLAVRGEGATAVLFRWTSFGGECAWSAPAATAAASRAQADAIAAGAKPAHEGGRGGAVRHGERAAAATATLLSTAVPTEPPI